MFLQDSERQQAQIGIVVEFAIALIGKLDGINRHSFNSFRLRVGECILLLDSFGMACSRHESSGLQWLSGYDVVLYSGV